MGLACAAMSTVGGAVTASAYLDEYPRFGAQAVRYTAAAVMLMVVVRSTSRWTVHRPCGREWWWLIAAATAGLSGYNLAVVRAVEHAEPTVVATFVAGVPLVLVIATSIRARRRVPRMLFVAAAVVVAGGVIVQGGGRSDRVGIAFAVVALACESSFTLLGVPVLERLGGVSVATHTTWIAALQLGLLAIVADGRGALPMPDLSVVLAITYLAAASAFAFAVWFVAVSWIGGDLAGLAAGVIPISALVSAAPLSLATLDARAALGTSLVVVGVLVGLRHATQRPTCPAQR